MATAGALTSYPPIPDAIWWISDYKPRSQMTPEELAERHRRDREARKRMKARMAVDPVYREERLAVARRATARWSAKNRNNPTVIAKRRAWDRTRWQRQGSEQNARKRSAYVGDRADKIRAANRAWYAANRETVKARQKAYRLANGDELRARDRERQRREYAHDPKKFNEYMKAWRAQNPVKARAYVRVSGNKRRAVAAADHFTFAQWLALVEQYAGRCGYCGAESPLEADHRTPLSRGGSNTIDNIIPACPGCNRRKHMKTESEFRALLAGEAARVATAPAKATPLDPGGSGPAG